MKYRNNIKKPIYFDDNYIEPPIIFEKWKLVNIDGVVKNYYWISTFGRLMNLKQQIIKPSLINSGYYTYRLYTGSEPKYKHMLVHRLVMLIFNPIENPEEYTVNHIDMNPANNIINNLEWMTQKQNNIEKNKYYSLYGSNIYNSLFSPQELQIIVEELNNGTSYKDILIKLGKDVTDNNKDYIGNIKRGKTYKKELEYLGLEIKTNK